ncbi:MAG: histidine phosphatase family protein [Candidatus Woesearchaeota archaeon]
MRLVLIRHGKPKITDGDLYRCRLGEEGIINTRDLASSGKIPVPDLIFTSPYNRTIDTARVFSEFFSVKYEILDCLKEWNLQSLNLKEDYAVQERLGWNDHDKVVFGNESLNNAKERILKCIKELVGKHKTQKNILLVSHGTVIDMFCSAISGREAKISDIRNSNHLDYAVVDFQSGKFNLIKDLVPTLREAGQKSS